ncbi:hypothetical protein ILYODFUR_005020 [Ilyodon furcidens]|uniref:Uncharacterized protein n=1 Tax=Ilyodon furcidens TaxID=33524 RepID=A0ABV0TSF6_9TELE
MCPKSSILVLSPEQWRVTPVLLPLPVNVRLKSSGVWLIPEQSCNVSHHNRHCNFNMYNITIAKYCLDAILSLCCHALKLCLPIIDLTMDGLFLSFLHTSDKVLYDWDIKAQQDWRGSS